MDKRYSILQKNFNECYVCGAKINLHIHEVFYGTANRKKSIEDGCCIKLCGKHHNLSKEGIHFNRELDLQIKKEMEMKWLYHYKKTKEDFIKRYGKNYL